MGPRCNLLCLAMGRAIICPPCLEPRVGLDDHYGSIPTWDILRADPGLQPNRPLSHPPVLQVEAAAGKAQTSEAAQLKNTSRAERN